MFEQNHDKSCQFHKVKMAFINSYDLNKLKIQFKKLSVLLNFQKNYPIFSELKR